MPKIHSATISARRRQEKWLLIVDNADDWETLFGRGNKGGMDDYLPQSGGGRILFTTRFRKVATNVAKNNIVDLSKMSREPGACYALGLFLPAVLIIAHNVDFRRSCSKTNGIPRTPSRHGETIRMPTNRLRETVFPMAGDGKKRRQDCMLR